MYRLGGMKQLRPLKLGAVRLDPFAVFAGSDALDPVAILEVPAYGVPQAQVENVRFRPAEIALELSAVDRVALVVAGAVGDEPRNRMRAVYPM